MDAVDMAIRVEMDIFGVKQIRGIRSNRQGDELFRFGI
jgi:hypothetical protein